MKKLDKLVKFAEKLCPVCKSADCRCEVKEFSKIDLDKHATEICLIIEDYIAKNDLNNLAPVEQDQLKDLVIENLVIDLGLNFSDDEEIENIDRESVFQYAMSLAHEVYGDDTNEDKVWKDVEIAIKEALANGGDTEMAKNNIKEMYDSLNVNFSSTSPLNKIYNI